VRIEFVSLANLFRSKLIQAVYCVMQVCLSHDQLVSSSPLTNWLFFLPFTNGKCVKWRIFSFGKIDKRRERSKNEDDRSLLSLSLFLVLDWLLKLSFVTSSDYKYRCFQTGNQHSDISHSEYTWWSSI
jgi:hypothetical protein